MFNLLKVINLLKRYQNKLYNLLNIIKCNELVTGPGLLIRKNELHLSSVLKFYMP